MNEKVLIPKVRFFKFTKNWEERKLKDVSKYSNGGSFENNVKDNGKYELITLKSVDMTGKLVSSGRFINDTVTTLKKDTLVMILSEQSPGLLGMTAQIPKDNTYILNQRVAEILPNNNISSHFLSLAINRNQQYFSKHGAGTKVQNISKPNVENYEFLCPDTTEQNRIDIFFKNLVNSINLQQQLLNDHKQLKKAMQQKMFPRKGETVPKIRFSGFVNDWKQCKLGDYLTIPEKKVKNVKNINELITLKLNLQGMYNGSNRATLELGSTRYYERKAGQFLYGKQNFFNGSMGIIPTELDRKATSGDVPALDINNINSDYLYTYVSRPSYWRAKESQSSGTGSKRIHEKTLQNFDISVPNRDEQTKIGKFFKQLDETIDFHQKKIETYQELKKAMLQKMFV